MNQVLLIEDDKNIIELLDIHLRDLPCNVIKALTGEEGLDAIKEKKFDLIVLDLMLPGIKGLEVCKRIRQNSISTPILMLTAKAEEKDIIKGFEVGADDYLTKPFKIGELLARVKAIFRRAEMQDGKMNIAEKKRTFIGIEIDENNRNVKVNHQKTELTRKEFDLLVLLAAQPGKSFSREQILNTVWGYEFEGFEHTVNSHINRLRSKIEPDINNPTYILTTWGIGYRFSEEV